MKKLSVNGVKWLKIIHIFFMVLMLGGIITSLTLRFSLNSTDFDEVLVGYRLLQIVSDHIIRYGAQGLLFSGVVYSVWTNWGWFKYRWVAVKWAVFFLQTIFGIFFIDRWMVDNLVMLEAEQAMALSNPVFVQNQNLMQYGALVQVVVVVALIGVSVLKPWKKKNER
ncbi:MAG TPA: hypothetical protein VD902_04955 [Symbiobacteriaceae bacterium]|nr:hypothetical protein [Symbiobacteriaceae bacterium]